MHESGIVFVGGLHRSGTTAFTQALGCHDELATMTGTGVPMDEGQHLQHCLPTARSLGGPGRFAFAEGAHLTETDPLATSATRDALLTAWSPYWRPARWRVEKSPPNLVRSRLLAALFPGAVFMMIERHPIAVALATRKWATDLTLEDLVAHWFQAYRLWDLDAASLEAPCLLIRYSELVDKPGDVLEAVAEVLGISAFPDAAKRCIDDVDGGYRTEWQQLLQDPAVMAVADRWAQRAAARGWDVFQI